MINYSTSFGKAMLAFFWGGMSSHLTLILYFLSGQKLPVVLLPVTFMIINFLLVFLKNYFDPNVQNI